MATICKIGETKEIEGKLYRKAADTEAGQCSGCAFCGGVCPGSSIGAAIENGGSECRDTIWKRVRVPSQIDRTKVPKKPKPPAKWDKIPLDTKITKSGLIDIANELGTENAKLKNQIADLKKKASK